MKLSTLLLSCVFVCSLSIALGQSVESKYDSAVSLIENAQLPIAAGIFKEIKGDLYKDGKYREYFEAQYYLAVALALIERNPTAAEDSLKINLQKAISISGKESLEAAEMYFGLGWLYDQISRKNEAETNYKIAHDIQENELGPGHKKTVKTKINYGQVLTFTGKLGRAEQYLIEAIKAYPDLYPEGHPEYVRLYTLAYNYYQKTNQKDKELSYALAAYEIALKQYGGNNPRMLSLMRNLSFAYFNEGSYSKAIEYADLELNLINVLIGNAPHIRKAEVMNNLGQFYAKLNLSDQSEESLKKALAVKKTLLEDTNPSTINSYVNLAFALIENQKYVENEELLNETFELLRRSEVDKFDIIYLRAVLAKTEKYLVSKELEALKTLAEEYFDLFQENITHNLFAGEKHINMLSMIENLSALSNDLEVSTSDLKAISKKIVWLDSINNEALNGMNLQADQLNFLEYYTNFNGVAIDHFYTLYTQTSDEKFLNEVYRFSEKNKATILSPEFTIARLKDQLNVPLEILELERKLLGEIVAEKVTDGSEDVLNRKLTYDSIKSLLRENYPDYYSLKYGQQIAGIAEVQKNLLSDQVILTYTLSEKYLYMMSLRPKSISIDRIPKESISSKIINFRNEILSLGSVEALGVELYRFLIPESVIPGERIVISTEEFLSSVPFDLLHSGDDYLGIENPITYVPSVNMWLNTTKNEGSMKTTALSIAPKFSDRRDQTDSEAYRSFLTPIPGAERELEIVKSTFGGEVLKNEEATLENFLSKLSNHNIIHLATHALLDNENPNLSRLYFSESTESSKPYLHNYEIYNLDLKADLVTLSACNTGMGEVQKGDGVNSLARGFMYAGVPATVVSLWPASDKSTPELMKYFYQNLKDGQPKDVALNNARKSYLANAQGKARHPFYWGGFVLIGDDDPIEEDTNLLVYLIPSMLIIVMILTVYRRKRSSN